MIPGNYSNESQLHVVKEQFARAVKRTEELNNQLEEAKHIQKIWGDLLMYIQKGWSCHILQLIDQEKRALIVDEQPIHVLIPAIDQIYKTARLQVDILQKKYPAFFEETCRENNLNIDRGSRHPKYTFFGGFFKLEVDDRKFIARLFDYEGKLAEFPADVGAAVEIIQREYKRVFDRSFDGNAFIRKLRKKFLHFFYKENLNDGAEIPIRKITRRLGKNIEGFRTDEFLVDLSRLAEKGPAEIDGRRLYLQHTKDTNQGMLLYGLSGGYIGYVVFKKE